MQTGKSTVKSIFDGTRIFNIPIYQRAYSWKESNLSDYLTDIINQQPNRQYFYGTFLFHNNGQRGDFKIIDIVDGQQRLTTFLLFMSELLKILNEKKSNKISKRTERIFIKDDDVFKLELSNEDNSFLHNYIFSDQKISQEKIASPSQRLLLEAKSYFRTELGKFSVELLEKIYTTITEADVLLYVVDEISEATQIFALLNDRGRPLTDLEAIKSFLMYNIGLTSKNPNQLIGNIQENFSKIYRLIEKHNLVEEDILRYHTVAFEHTSKTNSKAYIKDKISKLVNNNELDKAKESIMSYCLRLKETFEVFVEIQNNIENSKGLENFVMIGKVAPFYPLLLNTKKIFPNRFEELLSYLNKFVFRATLMRLRSSGESYINTRLRNKEDAIGIVNEFTQYNWWNINNRVKASLDYKNYYEWLSKNTVRYILFSYENELRENKGYPKLTIKEYFKTTPNGARFLNIEHITAKKTKGITFDDDFKENYVNNIGNLVIDYIVPNIRKGNKDTDVKMKEYKQAPLISQNIIDDTNCDWSNIEDVKIFINKRESILKKYINKTFEIE
ncbi:DUF262 domain-containing HNH endonuclease family protein [Tenacibaculum dicentrarchi]|nr:DUF262 domain-containing HNH endonuclease family protein [Tenacibaculum dicentrarchi]